MISLFSTRRLANCFGATFLLVFAWKFILLILTAQPIPANDAFGYDGAVVNYLLHGQYCNPSLLIPFPFSATHTFSIYPPLYQGVLCLWMAVFGTSALAAMWLHLVLFGLYELTLLAIFRRLTTPAWAVNLAGLFLLGITFDDRPDGLAHLFGMLALYAWVRSAESPRTTASPWPWLASLLVVLAVFTTPEIGGLYFGWLWLLTLGAAFWRKQSFPILPMGFLLVAPFALVALVKYGRPDLWAGFLEHAGQTPSLTGLRRPGLLELIKVLRTIPAIIVIVGLLVWPVRGRALDALFATGRETGLSAWLVMFSGLLITLGMTVACLLIFTADWILILAHFQPLIVGLFLTLAARQKIIPCRWQTPVFASLVLLVSVRIIGMSTWGAACYRDVSYAGAMQLVQAELARTPPDSTLVMSTAFLYEAAGHPRLRLIHEDWTHRNGGPPQKLNGDTLGLIKLKPAALILTQFDYYRRYQIPLAELAALPATVTYKTFNAARVPPPDSFPRFHQVVQHVAWAPVIVEFSWK